MPLLSEELLLFAIQVEKLRRKLGVPSSAFTREFAALHASLTAAADDASRVAFAIYRAGHSPSAEE